MNCPNCASTQTKSYSMVYDLFSSDDLSNLGYKCSPPPAPAIGKFFSFIILAASAYIALLAANLMLFSSFWIVGLIAFVATALALIQLWRKVIGDHQARKYAAQMDIWRRSWLCMQCNTDFQHENV